MTLCECGCGQEVTINQRSKLPNKFIHGHHGRKLPIQGPLQLCNCGCDHVVNNVQHRFIHDHHRRGTEGTMGFTGKKHTEETKSKMRETKRKISEMHKFNKIIKPRKSMYENKNCAAYLGIVVGERLCRHLFNNVEVMSLGNKGFDIICNRGKKIDVKTSALTEKRSHWRFWVSKNKIADYFICIALNNRTDLNVLHMWMIPGEEVNHLDSIKISSTTVHKWKHYERSIDDVQLCCTDMKKIEDVTAKI